MMRPMIGAPPPVNQALGWLRRHWVHFVITPPMLIAFTVLHESAHALLAWVQGGEIVEFVVWPDHGKWGYVRHEFAPGQSYSRLAISLAPYAMWTTSMCAVALLSLRRARWPFWAASTLFLWGYVGAFGDILNAWAPWALGLSNQNDFAHAFGTADSWQRLPVLGASVVVTGFGYPLQRRLYRDGSLGWRAYAILAGFLALVPAVVMDLI